MENNITLYIIMESQELYDKSMAVKAFKKKRFEDSPKITNKFSPR